MPKRSRSLSVVARQVVDGLGVAAVGVGGVDQAVAAVVVVACGLFAQVAVNGSFVGLALWARLGHPSTGSPKVMGVLIDHLSL